MNPTDAELMRLSTLIHQRNRADLEISALVQRPVQIGHLGEYIAARVFGIDLHESASHRGSDGIFTVGPLIGRSVNVKWYGMLEGLLDMNAPGECDYMLVLTGPRSTALTSRGRARPWLIDHVFLFESHALHEALATTGVKVGVATSARKSLWEAAEIFPSNEGPMQLSLRQRELLELFSSVAGSARPSRLSSA